MTKLTEMTETVTPLRKAIPIMHRRVKTTAHFVSHSGKTVIPASPRCVRGWCTQGVGTRVVGYTGGGTRGSGYWVLGTGYGTPLYWAMGHHCTGLWDSLTLLPGLWDSLTLLPGLWDYPYPLYWAMGLPVPSILGYGTP